MKKHLLAIPALLALASFAGAANIGVVDLEVIKNDYAKAKDNDKNLKAALDNAKTEMGARIEKLNKIKSEAEAADKAANDPMIKEEAKASKKADAKIKIEDFLKEQNSVRQFDQQTAAYFQQRAQQVDREIMADVKAKSEIVAKERKLDVVLPKGLLLSSEPALDISADVVKKLNEAYAANPVNPSAPVNTAAAAGAVTPTPAAADAAKPVPAK